MFKSFMKLTVVKSAALVLVFAGCGDHANAGRQSLWELLSPSAPVKKSTPVQDGCSLETPIPIGTDGPNFGEIYLDEVEFYEPIQSCTMAEKSWYGIKIFNIPPGQHVGVKLLGGAKGPQGPGFGFYEVEEVAKLRSERTRNNEVITYTTVKGGLRGKPIHETQLILSVENQIITKIELNTPVRVMGLLNQVVDSDRRERICVKKAKLRDAPFDDQAIPSDQDEEDETK